MGYQPYFFEIYFCYVVLNVDLYGNKTKPNQTKPCTPMTMDEEQLGRIVYKIWKISTNMSL